MKKLAFSVSVLLVFFAIAEGVATWREARRPPHWGVRDPVLGFQLRPGTEGELGGAAFRVNSRGFRGAEWKAERPPGGLRILAVGDSATFGFGVSADETWPKQLERRLAARFPDRPVEVINAGTPGWETAHGAAFLENGGLDEWQPDLVLVSFGFNDASADVFRHSDYDSELRRMRAHRAGEDPELVTPEPPEEKAEAGGFSDRFRDFPMNLNLTIQLRRLRGWVSVKIGGLLGKLRSSDLGVGLMRRLYLRDPAEFYARAPVREAQQHSVEAFARHLEVMVEACRQRGIPIVVLLQPRRTHRDFLDFLPDEARQANLRALSHIREDRPDEAIEILEAAHEARPVDAITTFNLSVAYRLAGRNEDADRALDQVSGIQPFLMNAVAERTADRLDVPVVDTLLAVEESPETDHFLVDRYHPRPSGYALIAEEVERVLVSEKLLDPGGA